MGTSFNLVKPWSFKRLRHQLRRHLSPITGSQPMYSWQSPSITMPGNQRTNNGRIQSLSHSLDSGSSGSVKYQISLDDGASWLYYNTTTNAWESDLSQRVNNTSDLYGITLIRDHGATKANTIDEINTNLSKLNTYNTKFKWRAFLESNGTQQVELQSVTSKSKSYHPPSLDSHQPLVKPVGRQGHAVW